MPLVPPISDLESLRSWPALSQLLAWRPGAVLSAKYDRGELSVSLAPSALRDACFLLRDDPVLQFKFLSDLTCVDWYPSEPRLEVIYHLLSLANVRARAPEPGQIPSALARLRLKVRLDSSDPKLDSVTPVWPSANFFEREVFDLFGVHFEGHPYLRRLLMPENWEGHPLRKDYPVEGYR